MTVVVNDPDFTLHHGDALEVLRTLPDQSVHMVATSPPFYGLRDYGVDGQIGLEESPDEWVARLVAVFRECRRVLRDDGTLWIEIGDSYVSGQGGRQSSVGEMPSRALALDSRDDVGRNDVDTGSWRSGATSKITPARGTTDLKPKDLLGQPWMLAFALRADGWFLRSEIIWHRPNPMPESVSDRPTKSHSTVFLLSKRPRYFFDADAIREPFSLNTNSRGKGIGVKQEQNQESGTKTAGRNNASFGRATQGDLAPHLTRPPQDETLDGLYGEAPRGPDGRRVTTRTVGSASADTYGEFGHEEGRERWPNPSGANARSVWTIPTEPTPFAHFATWPSALVRKMIMAGTSERGCCPDCGAPWVRQTERTPMVLNRSARTHAKGRTRPSGTMLEAPTTTTTTGWEPTCDHGREPVPCVVLDPFMGSGTTALVARALGRRSVGIELNADYCQIAASRMGQQSLLAGA